MIFAEFRGIRKVPKRAMRLQTSFPSIVEEATTNAVTTVMDNAMDILRSNEKGTAFSHGWPVIHIGDAWEGFKPGDGKWFGTNYMVILRNVSDHAAAVEFGVHHTIFPKKKKGMLYLGEGTYVPFVKGQAGYHYLQQSIDRKDEIRNAYISTVKKRLMEILI